jgi:hypothetical protein
VIWGGSAIAAAAARRFASQLAANAKYPAIFGLLPEAGHDQVATFDGPYAPPLDPAFPAAEDLGGPFGSGGFGDGDFDSLADEEADLDGLTPDEASLRLVLIADPAGEHPAVERTRTAAASLAAARGIDVSDIMMDRSDPLRRLAGTVQLLDYASVYLGIAGGIDPLAIAAIKDLRDLAGRE